MWKCFQELKTFTLLEKNSHLDLFYKQNLIKCCYLLGTCFMLNTYGIRSINAETFNTYGSPGAYLPRSLRDVAITLLRIHNLSLNILGYIPGVAQISGCVRMGIGACMIVLTAALGNPNADEGLIIGRWYQEALLTGISQIARGALEAFVPFGFLVNGSLDIIATYVNLKTECSHLQYCGYLDVEEREAIESRPPYRDPNYPAFLFPLYLA